MREYKLEVPEEPTIDNKIHIFDKTAMILWSICFISFWGSIFSMAITICIGCTRFVISHQTLNLVCILLRILLFAFFLSTYAIGVLSILENKSKK